MKITEHVFAILKWMPKNEISWYCFFRDFALSSLMIFGTFYYFEIKEFLSFYFGDGSKFEYAHGPERRYPGLIIVSVIGGVGYVNCLWLLYNLIFKRTPKLKK